MDARSQNCRIVNQEQENVTYIGDHRLSKQDDGREALENWKVGVTAEGEQPVTAPLEEC